MPRTGDPRRLRRHLPAYTRGCYGCYGPQESPNTQSLAGHLAAAGAAGPDLVRLFRSYNADAEAFRRESERHDITNNPR